MANNKSNDTELMTRLAAGDMAALGDIARIHQGKVLSLSYRVLGDWHRAEDVAQETFLRVYRAAKRYKPQAKFTTWFYRIVVNLCFDEQRKQAKATAPLEDADPVVLAKSESNAAERKEVVELVKTAVNELPERQKWLIGLCRRSQDDSLSF